MGIHQKTASPHYYRSLLIAFEALDITFEAFHIAFEIGVFVVDLLCKNTNLLRDKNMVASDS